MKALPIVFSLIVLFTGCQKDKHPDFLKLEGCMVPYAKNYKKRAAIENESCKFGDSDREGIYVFSDSSFNNFDGGWYYHTNVERALHKVPNSENQWVFVSTFRQPYDFDYYNLYNIELVCYLDEDTLRFLEQRFDYDDSLGFTITEEGWGELVYPSSTQGYFRNDSLFYYASSYWLDDDNNGRSYLCGVKK